jgi:cytochrome c peroxidase
MHLCAIRALAGLSLALLICVEGSSDERPKSTRHELQGFSQATLVRRFDTDADGTLSAAERAALCDSFGGVDVPMLPAKDYHYGVAPEVGDVVAPQLEQMDNTPAENPTTDSGATLGRVLFYDKQLSANATIACASCHLQQHAFADIQQFSVGFEAGLTQRNAMGLANLRYTVHNGRRPGFFWDERAPTLEAQVLVPIQDKLEMGMELSELEVRLSALPYYPPLFEAAFGSPEITSQRIARAVAQFLRAMTSFDAKFDRAAVAAGGDYSTDFAGFTAEQNRGKSLFIDGVGGIAEMGCAHCHIPPTFGMPKSFNNGLDLHYQDRGLGAREVPSNDPFTPTNDGKFKAPSLRNIALTAPYMHDGRFQTLEQVIEHYSSGIRPHPNLGVALNKDEPAGDQATLGFRLMPAQKQALVAFLKTLTDERFVADPRFADPFVRKN